MKFVFATDSHLKGRNPSSRTDDFPRAMLLKLEELCYVAKRIGATAILHGGDMFDVPDVANTMIGEVATIIRKYGVPFYVVPGNHDIFGYQIKSLPQTALGVLEKAGVIQLLTRDGGAEIFDDGQVKVAVQGQEYYADIDKGAPQDYEFPGWIQADHKILIPHSMLVPKEFFPGVPYTLTKDVNTLADLVLIGHYHPGFDDHTVGSTRYINPGSMARLDATKSSLGRIPEYLIIDAQPQAVLDVQFKTFKTAKPGPEVLDNSHLKAAAARQVQVGQFQSSVANVRQLAHTDINSILLNLATQQSQPIEVIKAAKDAIVAAEQNDKATTSTSGFVELNTHVWISQVELENFQSHPNTTMDLMQGLNAIVGQSDSGKTAIMRAIRWVAYNEPKGTDFIRTGSNDVRVRITMNDGTWVERGRTRKVAGYYTIGHTEPDGTQVMDTKFEGFGNDIPIEIQNILQMPKSNLGRGDAETLSMAYQLNAPFLISEGASMKASVIGRLTGVHLVDTAISSINTEHLRAKKKLTEEEDRLKEHEEKLQQFADLDTLEATIMSVETLIDNYDALEKQSDDLMNVRSELQKAHAEQAIIKSELQNFAHVKIARQRMDKIDAAFGTYTQLVQIAEDIRDGEKEHTALQQELKQYAGLPKAKTQLAKIETAAQTYRELASIKKEYDTALQEKQILTAAMQNLPDSKKVYAMITQLEELAAKHQDMSAIATEITEHNDSKRIYQGELIGLKHLREDAEKELQNLLSSIDVCPVCARPMETHTH